MCTAYRVGKKKGASKSAPKADWSDEDLGEDRLMRPTEEGVVAMADGSLLSMRWGFEREWSRAIVNARQDKLDGIWKEAFENRRCLIPVSAYYEWAVQGGRKQAYQFQPEQDEVLWVAGIWEEHESRGLCYNLVTTTPNRMVAKYHSRMPALLTQGQLSEFLEGRLREFDFPEAGLSVREVASPLKSDPQQQELW